jgi:hypothetical protein
MIITEKNYENASHNTEYGVVISGTFLQKEFSNVTHVSTSKQLVIFPNCVDVISQLCPTKWLKDVFSFKIFPMATKRCGLSVPVTKAVFRVRSKVTCLKAS